MLVKNFTFFIYLMVLQTCFGVDMDYYNRPALRSRTLSCENSLQQIYCQIKCGVKSALCIQKDCYCLTLTSASDNIVPNSQAVKKISSEDDVNMDYEDNDEPNILSNVAPIPNQIFYALRPTLRHHIAHFCPNLDVARECIKKCIAQGKPAFCGKDHVCYCGHKYSHSSDDTVSVKNIYSQFKDLYEKYFGKDVTDSEELK